MKLWTYLKQKMAPFASRTAFAGSGVRYGDLLAMEEGGRGGKLRICTGSTREEQALAILRCLADHDVAVPVSPEYGEGQARKVGQLVAEAGEDLEDLAFVMFTSGTTGEPKGVMLTDENLIANLDGIASYFRLEGAERICIARPLSHIAVITGELLYALCCGLTLHFYEEAFMPRRLLSFLRARRAEVFCGTPTLFLARAAEKGDWPVRISALSGEILTAGAAQKLAERFPETAFYHVYGLTEHSPRALALPPEQFGKKPGSIGLPMPGVEAEIREGELVLRSPCVMKGYFRNEAATREKLREGWLFTGDAAHQDEDGCFYIDGRKDSMMIRAGLNIYPEEIEGAARACPGVEDCTARQEREEVQTRICLDYTGEAEPSKVRKFLLGKLNPHAAPDLIRKVSSLPRTPSGKKKR